METRIILSILATVSGVIGTCFTIFSEKKRIRVDKTAPFCKPASLLSSEADPTPAIRREKLYDPHNKKMNIVLWIGIVLIIISAIIGIILIF
ncbi:hypothetical protein [Parabacteroides sp.]|uniref:hypothetical protein n=1 Tax=Parabacteroides sp. TaxID=1869337 RepID=UPI00307FDDDE